MISMHNVSNSGQALHYFSKDNYYTEKQGLEESEWFGKGAQALGLQGKIEKEDFFEALEGKFDGQQLGRVVRNEETGEQEREHRPGTDITFSAPKSVSLVAEVEGAQEVRQAHEEAVKVALGYIERELSYTRKMEDGELTTEKTGNLAVAMFRHNTSRDLDPQTHTHSIVMNATKREDGEWRSLTNEEIYKAQRVVGAIYNAELADRLQGLGYELRRTDERGNFEIAGITREQIEHFSQRRAGMEAAMKERGLDIETATPEQKEQAALATRARKTDVDHAELIGEWKQRAKDVGIDFQAIQQKAAENRAQGGVMRDDRLTGRAAMEFAAAHVIEREAVVSKNELMRTAIEHGAGRVSPRDVEKAFDKLEKDGHLLQLPDGNYTTKKMLSSEQWALAQVRESKGTGERVLGENTVRERLERIERRQGFDYTVGQKEAITSALTTHDKFVAVQGLAGTGKTTMLKGMRELAEEAGYKVRGMAPTGAASKVLARETGIDTDTVSMFMIKEKERQKGLELAAQHAPDFKRQKELWVVDESSFLSQRQKAQLDNLANKAGAKVVYLGDTLQLQGVEAGKPFELAQKNGIETAHMTEISRQKTPELKAIVDKITGRDELAPGERLTNVELKRNGEAFKAMDEAGMVREVKGGRDMVIQALVKDIVKMDVAERERTIVITAYNKDRQDINEGVRGGMRERGELVGKDRPSEVYESKGWTRAVTKEAQYYKEGDVVRFGRNYKAIEANKGEYMRVAAVEPTRGVVVLEKADGRQMAWEPRKYNNVEVYDKQTRSVAQGDLIRITRNEAELKEGEGAARLKNGEVGRVVALKDNVATIEVKQGKESIRRDLDLSQNDNKHWDHAYASTVHASQGSTQHRTMFHIRAPEGENEYKQKRELEQMAKVFGDRSFYVGATRASHELRVYTNDKEAAAAAVAGKQDKTSAVETIQRHTQEAGDKGKSTGVMR